MKPQHINAKGYRVAVQDEGTTRWVTVEKGSQKKTYDLFTDQFDCAEDTKTFRHPIVVFPNTIKIGKEEFALPPVQASPQEKKQLDGLSTAAADAARADEASAVQRVPFEKGEPIGVHIRWMIRRDMREVLGIEDASFEFPWLEDDFIRCLRQRNCIGMVAEHDNEVVGFMIYELHKNRLEILNFAVNPEMRGHDIGRQMATKLQGKLSQQRRNQIRTMVRETNVDALNFFKACGFRAVNTVRDAYDDSAEDGIIMRFLVPELDEFANE